MSPDPPHDRRDFEIALICALPVEADAVHAVFDKFWEEEGKNYGQAPGDDNSYTTGVIGDHNVVLTHMPGMGKVNAASVAASLKSSFRGIKLGLVVGICGGVPFGANGKEEIYMGDIIFSTAVVQYDYGRQYPEELRRKDTLDDSLGRPSPKIRGVIAKLKTKHFRNNLQNNIKVFLEKLNNKLPETKYPGPEADMLFEPSYLHKHRNSFTGLACDQCNSGPGAICELAMNTTCEKLGCLVTGLVNRRKAADETKAADDAKASLEEHAVTVHFGVLGSGDAVMKSGRRRDRLAKEAGIIAFEMEGAGVWDHFPSIVIKGVCDYADSHKHKKWQMYAAATAAAGLKAFLKQWAPEEPNPRVHVPKVIWHVPLSPTGAFIGRKMVMEMLEDRLFQAHRRSRVAVFGLGGVGKSRLALELAHRTKEQRPTYSVLWIQATSHLTFEQDILEIGKKLEIPGIEDDGADVKNLVKQRLDQKSAGHCLIILDNADDEDVWGVKASRSGTETALVEYLPDCAIVVTTRSRRIAVYLAGKEVIEVPEMNQEEAVETFTGLLVESQARTDVEQTSTLVDRLTYLPLAIVQAAAYINMNDASIQDYLDLLEEPEENVMDLLSEDFGDGKRYPEGRHPVASTWRISFDQMRAQRPQAADFLAFASCLSEKNIPLSLLPDIPSNRERIEVMGALTGYSFLKKQNEVDSKEVLYQMHRLVRLATRNWLKGEGTFTKWTQTAVSLVGKRFPLRKHENRNQCALYMPHAQILFASVRNEEYEERYILLEKMGLSLKSDGEYSEALKLHASVVSWRETNLGSLHIATLSAYHSIGESLRAQGNWNEAKVYFEKALTGDKEALGSEHADTLTCMLDLAATHRDLGNWVEAEKLGEQVKKTRQEVLGGEHPDTLASMAELVWTLYKLSRLRKAEELGLHVMNTRFKVLQEDHPDTLTSMAHLAAIYEQLGRSEEAEGLKLKVLRTRTRVLGREHPSTLISMVNLALTYRHLGKLEEAESLELEALDIRGRALGSDHPSTLIAMNNLAWTRRNQGRMEEARVLMAKCIPMSIEKLGRDHPSTQERLLYWGYQSKGDALEHPSSRLFDR